MRNDIDSLVDEAWKATANKTIEEIDEVLRQHGYDPVQVEQRSKVLAEVCLENVRLKARIKELEERIKFLEKECGRLASLVWIHFPNATMPPEE